MELTPHPPHHTLLSSLHKPATPECGEQGIASHHKNKRSSSEEKRGKSSFAFFVRRAAGESFELAQRLHEIGVHACEELVRWSLEAITHHADRLIMPS
jgi:hypothetical protein